MQSNVIEKQCADAIDLADKKLEAAEERRDKHSSDAETAADPDDVKAVKESGKLYAISVIYMRK